MSSGIKSNQNDATCNQDITYFESILLAAQRTKDIISGSPKVIEGEESDMLTAIAEVKEKVIDMDALRLKAINNIRYGSGQDIGNHITVQTNLDEMFSEMQQDSKQLQDNLINSNIFANQNIVE